MPGVPKMRITNNLIKQVVADVAGDDVIPLVIAIKDKKNISEFKIAELIREPINNTRNKLYRLYDNNLIHFVRKKDRKKGWYIYYWTFNIKQIRFLVVKLKRERLERLKARFVRETTDQFYICPSNCIRLEFEQATNFDYKCPECGTLMELQDNIKEIGSIKAEITETEKFLHNEMKELGLLPKKMVKERKEKTKIVLKKKVKKAEKKGVKKEKKSIHQKKIKVSKKRR